MDLMSTLAPKKVGSAKSSKVLDTNNTNNTVNKTNPIQNSKFLESENCLVDVPSKVKNLESGDITTYSNIPDKIPESKKLYTILDIYSNCYLYILYNSQFKKLADNYDIQKKFSSEAELLQREIRHNSINKQLQYMDKKYDSLNFEFKIELQTEMDIEQIHVKDKLHFKQNTVIVPLEYNYIIDNILSRIQHNFVYVTFCNTHDNQRIILPATFNNILSINKQFCNTCEFYSICDGK